MLINALSIEWANVTTPQTRFEPHKYTVTAVISDEDAEKFKSDGFRVNTSDEGEHRITAKRSLTRVYTDRDTGEKREEMNDIPKLLDKDKEPMDVTVGNGSVGVVQVKPYENKYGKFFELQAVMVTELKEYNPDNNEIQF
tara:strand:- start:478 stop:897 length:420 start_codon:yes stop_codon:yes gene_type:complete